MSNREKLLNMLINLSNDELSKLVDKYIDDCVHDCPAYNFCKQHRYNKEKDKYIPCERVMYFWLNLM